MIWQLKLPNGKKAEKQLSGNFRKQPTKNKKGNDCSFPFLFNLLLQALSINYLEGATAAGVGCAFAGATGWPDVAPALGSKIVP